MILWLSSVFRFPNSSANTTMGLGLFFWINFEIPFLGTLLSADAGFVPNLPFWKV